MMQIVSIKVIKSLDYGYNYSYTIVISIICIDGVMDQTLSNHQSLSVETAPSIEERLKAIAELLLEVIIEEELDLEESDD